MTDMEGGSDESIDLTPYDIVRAYRRPASPTARRSALSDARAVRALIEGQQLGVLRWDTSDGSVSFSDAAYRLHGRPRWRRVRTMNDALESVHPEDREVFIDGLSRAATGATDEVTYRAHRDDDEASLLTISLVRQSVGERVVIHGLVRETAHINRADLQRRGRLSLLDAVLAASPDGILVVDAVSHAVLDANGQTAIASVGDVLDEVEIHEDDVFRLRVWVARISDVVDGEVDTVTVRLRRDSMWRWHDLRSTALQRDPDDVMTKALVISRDVHDSAEATRRVEAQLRHDALHDSLTGLPNRRLLIDRLERALTRRRRVGGTVAVCFFDVDGLKSVNDNLGHEAGDEMLRETARRVGNALRDSDTLGRLGGDEFVAICEDVDGEAGVDRIGRRLLEAVSGTATIAGNEVSLGASIGIAVPTADREAADEVLGRADEAMYQAKAQGGRRVVRSGGVPVEQPDPSAPARGRHAKR